MRKVREFLVFIIVSILSLAGCRKSQPVITSIEINAPTKVHYIVGDTFSLDGGSIQVNYSDNSYIVVNMDAEGVYISSLNMQAVGTRDVTVTYQGKSATFSVTIAELGLQYIEAIFTPGDSVIYAPAPAEILRQYLTILGTNNDGSSAGTIPNENYSILGQILPGNNVITVDCGGITTTFSVQAIENYILSYNIRVPANRTIFDFGASFNYQGLVVECHLHNGVSIDLDVDEYSIDYSNYNAFAEGNYVINIKVGGLIIDSYEVSVVRIIVQGITDAEIIIGNTVAESGAYSFIGKPFNNGLRAYLEAINLAGGIGGRTIRLINRDDGFDGNVGVAYTEMLAEQDEVFALVGHFGTDTVNRTINYIKTKGIPMVYAASAVNELYHLQDELSSLMPVQPIFKTEGRILLARAFAETGLFGENLSKIAVIHTQTIDGFSIKEGIEAEAEALGVTTKIRYFALDGAYTSAISSAKLYEPDVVIIAANTSQFRTIYSEMKIQNLNKPILTSYVNGTVSAINGSDYDSTRPIYTNLWCDTTSPKGLDDYQAYTNIINASNTMTAAEKTDAISGLGQTYAISGYLAAYVFIEGLKAVAAKSGDASILTWANYVLAMQDLGPITLPMSGTIDLSNGKRLGLDSMALIKYLPADGINSARFDHEKDFEKLDSMEQRILG